MGGSGKCVCARLLRVVRPLLYRRKPQCDFFVLDRFTLRVYRADKSSKWVQSPQAVRDENRRHFKYNEECLEGNSANRTDPGPA